MDVKPNRFAIARQFAPTQVKSKVTEGDLVAIHRIRRLESGIFKTLKQRPKEGRALPSRIKIGCARKLKPRRELRGASKFQSGTRRRPCQKRTSFKPGTKEPLKMAFFLFSSVRRSPSLLP